MTGGWAFAPDSEDAVLVGEEAGAWLRLAAHQLHAFSRRGRAVHGRCQLPRPLQLDR